MEPETALYLKKRLERVSELIKQGNPIMALAKLSADIAILKTISGETKAQPWPEKES